MAGPEHNSDVAAQPLFREQVLTSGNSQWLGAIRLAQPITAWLIVAITACIAVGTIAFFILGDITKKTRIAGITVPVSGSISLMSPTVGILVRNYVREGQHVGAGEKLFELSTEHHGRDGEITALVSQQLAIRRQSLEAEYRLRAGQAEDRRRLIAERLLTLSAEQVQIEQEIKLAQRRLGLAQKSLASFETLQGNGYVSSLQTQQRQEDVIDLDGKVSALERSRLQLVATRQSLVAEQDTLRNTLATDMAQLQRAQATLQQEAAENRARGSNAIVATQSGRVTTVVYEAGQSVIAGQVLATLIPDGTARDKKEADIAVQLFAPSRAAGFIAPGQKVLIRYQSFPYQKFGLQQGVIADVSKTPLAPSELPANLASSILGGARGAGNGSEALYRVRVTLARQAIRVYGEDQPLKPGMTLEADVVQDRRRIWEWVAEPLLAAARRS